MEQITITEQEKQDLILKAKQIKKYGTILLPMFVILIIAIIASFASLIVVMNDPYASVAGVLLPQIFLILFSIVYSILNLLFNILAIIKISGTNWKVKSLEESKTTFWVMSLVFFFFIGIVPPILWIVWGSKVINELNSVDLVQPESQVKRLETK